MAGKVFLVGAGPGAADLLTLRAHSLLQRADVVLHDALVSEEVLAVCAQAKRISVGKRSGQRSAAQADINQAIIDQAKLYSVVVRLKGGDPMLFGRADEEMRALENAGIEYEIVPGITTAFAAAAATRQALTQRGIARNVAFFTSSTAPDERVQTQIPQCDTLIQYMGGKEARLTGERMIEAGYDPALPVITIENCSRADQKITRILLQDLAQGLPDCAGPILVMIGESMRQRTT